MIIYFFLLFIVSLPVYEYGVRTPYAVSHKKGYYLYTTICFTAIIGLRAVSVGCDTVQYQYRYTIYQEVLDNIASRNEIGFHFFNYICNKIGLNFQQYLFVTSFLMCLFTFYFFYKYSKNIYFSVFLFVSIGLFTVYMSGLKQSLAISFCMLALVLVLNKKIKFAIPLLVLATIFHNSAAVFFIVLFLHKVKLNKAKSYIFITISALALLYKTLLVELISKFMPEKYNIYDFEEGYNMNILLPIIAVLIPLFCTIFNNDVDENGFFCHETSILLCMSCLNIIFTMLAFNNSQLGRMAYYFVNANMVLIPNTVLLQKKDDKRIMATILGVIGALYFVISTQGGTLSIDNYLFYWQ